MEPKTKISIIAMLALFISAGLFAFKAQNASLTPGVYYFQGTSSDSGWQDENNYEAAPPAGGAACDSGTDLPCRISISPNDDLQQFLNDHSNVTDLIAEDNVSAKEETPL